tara:strand:+ start:412 stop:1128 length:717 start_codon:yes stop_codon:yes gene_type:complete
MKDINSTIVIDLKGKSEEEIWRGVKYTRRKYVGQALRAGLKHEKRNTEKDLRKMYEMHMKTIVEGGAVLWSYEKWKRFVEPAGDRFYFVKKGKNVVGCFALAEIDESFYSKENVGNGKGIRPVVYASKKEYQKYRTHDYLYWITIKYALEKGYDFVDLGGYQINARGHLVNVNKFKGEWGGEIKYYHWDYPFLTAIRRKLIRNSSLFWKLNNFAKRKVGKIEKSVHDDYAVAKARHNA